MTRAATPAPGSGAPGADSAANRDNGVDLWRRTAAWFRAPAVVILALGIGLATGRPDLIAIGAPLALGWILALAAARARNRRDVPHATTHLHGPAAIGSNGELVTRVTGMDGVDFALVAQPAGGSANGGITAVPGGMPDATIRTALRADRWGVHSVAQPDSLAVGPDGLYAPESVEPGPVLEEIVLPAIESIPPLTLPPILGGWAGAHVSRRPGQGSDLVDLREFAPGDRLKSIHWRAYARHQRLYTRRTLSDADADLMVCLDLSFLLAPRRAAATTGRLAALRRAAAETLDWWRRLRATAAERDARAEQDARRRRSRKSSLDFTVDAAAAIAAAHLAQGDRVGMVTATIPRRTVRPGSGNRQLQRIRHQLARLDGRRRRILDASWWGLRPGQIVIWCSPLVTMGAIDAALTCRARGHRVIVIDTAPLTGLVTHAERSDVDHLRLLTVERELRIRRLAAHGIPVVSWDRGDIGEQLAVYDRARRGRA